MKKMKRGLVLSALTAWAVASAVAAPIRLKSGEVNTSRPLAVSAAATFYAAEEGLRVYLVQSADAITPAWRQAIEQAGGKILGYVPDNAYLVAADRTAAAAVAGQVKYAYFGEYRPEYKVSSSISGVLSQAKSIKLASADENFKASSYAGEFVLTIFPFAKAVDVAEKISALDGCVVLGADGDVVRARLSEEAIATVLAWPEIEWLESAVESKLFNNVAVGSSRMNVEPVWPNGISGLGLTGEGQVVAVCDTGLDTGDKSTLHEDVRGRVTRTYCYGRSNSWNDPNGHGTHVVGSVLGDGTKSSGTIRGSAYKANLIFQSILNSRGGLTTPYSLTTLFQAAYDSESGKPGARLHSNSWGGGDQIYYPEYMGYYSSESRTIDRFMFEHPDMLIFFAAGNEGVDYDRDGVIDSDSISTQGSAKNCMTVGATENDRTTGGYVSAYRTWGTAWPGDYPVKPIYNDMISGGAGMAAFSSRGPCDDGRIKPDIVAPGTDVVSLQSSATSSTGWGSYNSHYAYMGGTSMATPLTAGAAVLVRQWLVEKQSISNPDGATVKAVMLAGAKSLTPGQYGQGTTREIPNSYPNNVEGWGQVNLGNSLANSKGVTVLDGKIIAHGETQEYKVSVASAGSPLAIVMAYMDAPASSASSAQLVNDLDLTVTTPSGTKLYPNSRTSADHVNNVEGVRIASAEKGIYTITVKATSVTTPMSTSWTGGKANATRYSVVANGATQSAALEVSEGFLSSQSTTIDDAASKTEFMKGETVYVYARVHNPGTVDFSEGFTVRHELLSGSVSKGSLAKAYSNVISASGDYDVSAFAWSGLQGLSTGSYTYRLTLKASGMEDVQKTVTFTVAEPPSPLTSVEILGASSVGGGTKSTYTCRATLSDGTEVTATPVWSISSGSSHASISQDGTLQAYATEVSRSIVLRASCTYNGVTRSGTKTVAINPVLSLPVALDCPAWTLAPGGSAEWFGQTKVTSDGVDAGQSGAISHNQSSWFETTVTGPGTLSFKYRVSTELNYDQLVVSADGVDWFKASGASAWEDHSIVFGSGSHTVRFAYVKDVNNSANEDAVYLDQLRFTGAATPETLTITGDGTVPAGSTLQLGCTATMSDGTTPVVTSDCEWSISSGATYASISDTGLLTAASTTADRSVVVRVSYTAGGVTKTATRTIVVTGVAPQPSAPVITRSGEGDYSAAELGWSSADYATSYRIYRATTSSRPSTPLATVSGVLSYSDATVSPGVEYHYWVSAVNTSGEAVSLPGVAYRAVQLTVSATALTMGSGAGTTNLSVKTNATLGSSSSESWLTVATSGTTGLTLTAQANPSTETRSATVSLTAAASTDHPQVLLITVDQSGQPLPEQADPDLTFTTFDESWDSNWALYTAETDEADKACRLFNTGDAVHLRWGWGNFGEGDAEGTVTNVVVVGRRQTECHSNAVDERDIEVVEVTRQEVETELHLTPGAARYDTLSLDAWKSLQPGVYIAKVFLNEPESIVETDYYNNDLGFRFAVRNPVSLRTALDCESSSLDGLSSAAEQWYGTAGLGYDGVDCAMTKLSGDGSQDVLTATVSGAGKLSFVYKVATEASFDVFSFKVDGKERMSDSGLGEWKEVSFDIEAGAHTFTWTYAKDSLGSDGDDCVFLDKLVWTPVRIGVAPSDFTASVNKSTYVMLTWTKVSEATTYVIERASHGSDDWTQIYNGASSTVYDDDTLSGQDFDYRVKSVYPDGESDWSAIATGHRTASITSPTYRWIPAASGADGFTFTPNGRWTAESNVQWLRIDTAVGTNSCKFVYRYDANTETEKRTGKITITVGEPENGEKTDGYWMTKTITVNQNAAIDTGGTLPLAEAANTTLEFKTSEDHPWIGQRRISHDGVASMRSGEVGQYATSRVETVVATGGQLVFWWGSSSGNKDYLTLYVNGVRQGSISGYSNTLYGKTNCCNWACVTNTIPEKGAVIAWEYVRANESSFGEDAAFVDQISWEPVERTVSPEDAWFQKYYPDLFNRLGVSWENRQTLLTMQSPGTVGSTGKVHADGIILTVRDDYTAGTDPLDSDSLFRAQIEMTDGVPAIRWTPTLDPADAALRNYLIYGKRNLSDTGWSPVADGHEAEFNFFRVTVELQ